MSKIEAVYVDLDGVLVNFMAGATKAHGWTGKLTPGECHLHKDMGISLEQFWASCQGHSFWEGLQVLPDSHMILGRTLMMFGGHRVWLLSTPSDDPGSFSGKYAWVGQHLPALQRRLILAPDKSVLSRPGHLLIDDGDANVARWRNPPHWPGGPAILLPRAWNSRHAESEGPSSAEIFWRELGEVINT